MSESRVVALVQVYHYYDTYDEEDSTVNGFPLLPLLPAFSGWEGPRSKRCTVKKSLRVPVAKYGNIRKARRESR